MKKIKLQYYLRGLGVGILVTAVIMGTALPVQKQELSDTEIKKKAAELGMVDANSLVLSDLQEEQSATAESTDSPEETESVSSETEPVQEVPEGTETVEEAQTETPEASGQEDNELAQTEMMPTEETITEDALSESEGMEPQEQASQPKVTGVVNEDGSAVTITIQSGANSYSVSKVLADMGLVSDAKVFDKFLCNAGYSKKIHTGNHVITVGMDEEEIAKKITGNR